MSIYIETNMAVVIFRPLYMARDLWKQQMGSQAKSRRRNSPYLLRSVRIQIWAVLESYAFLKHPYTL